jgi:fructokinase
MLISGTESLNAAVDVLLQKTDSVFAITIGKEGTLLGYKGETEIVPSISVKPVDTTGAGDAFVGAVLYQLNENWAGTMNKLSRSQWKEIVLNSNKAGARTCEYMGAMEAFKHLDKKIFD